MSGNIWNRLRQVTGIEREEVPTAAPPRQSDCERFREMLSKTEPGYVFIFEGDLFECKPAKSDLSGRNVHAVEYGCVAPFDMVASSGRISWVKNHVTVKEGDGEFTIDYKCF